MNIKFAPTIYEHAAALIGKTPSEVASSASLMTEAHLCAYETYRCDNISVGIDIYNVEAEALGCKLVKHGDNSIPSIDGVLLSDISAAGELLLPEPCRDGRMPLFLESCKKIRENVPVAVAVNGTVTGPFTLAAILRGFEDFIYDIIEQPETAEKLMGFACDVAYRYACALAETGVGISINDSWISPPLCSHEIYRTHVFKYQRNLISRLKSSGIGSISLVCGGNTGGIAGELARTGSSLIIADWVCDRALFKRVCSENNIWLRANVDSALVCNGNDDELRESVRTILRDCGDYEKLIFGCGVVSYDTPPDRIHVLKRILLEEAGASFPK